MKKLIILIFVFTDILLLITGCQTATPALSATKTSNLEISPVILINPLGPLVIPASGISSGKIKGNTEIKVENWKTIDEATGLLAGNDTPFAVLPVTTAANLYASGVDLVLLGVHEWKAFYLVGSQDVDFSGWKSLVGKTIYSPEAKGQTVDTLTRYALIKEGIQPDDEVTFIYAPAQEIVSLFTEGKIDFAALPEPYVSLALASGKGQIIMDYQKYWSEENGGTNGLPIAGLFVKRDFYENYPQITKDVEQTFSDSIQWANNSPDKALEASSSILPLSNTVMKNALQRLKFEYVPASKCKQEVLDFLKKMQTTYPEGIKAIPPDVFFAE
jgi:NitT/TauT family transport system substrate-binding protein